MHTTGDAERAFPFYREVLGIELTRSHFRPPDDAPLAIASAAQAASDPLVWDLTDTRGARFRTVFTQAANTPFGLELSEFFDIPRSSRQANAWDPGAARLIFAVRDLDAVLATVRRRGDPIVTVGGAPLATPSGKAVLVRDPDGSLVELVQASAAAQAAATAGPVVSTTIGITVASTPAALEFYHDLLGFEVRGTHAATAAELRLHGVDGGRAHRDHDRHPGHERDATAGGVRVARARNAGAVPLADSGRRRAAAAASGPRSRRVARADEGRRLWLLERRRTADPARVRALRVRDRSGRRARGVRGARARVTVYCRAESLELRYTVVMKAVGVAEPDAAP